MSLPTASEPPLGARNTRLALLCVAIFAARNKPRVWFPYGRQHRVLYHQTDCWGCGLETCIVERKKCLTSITVEEVVAEVRAILG